EGSAHEAFLAPRAVGLNDGLVLVRQQGERKFVLLAELGVGFCRVRANAEDNRAELFKLAESVTECAGLLRATRCIVPGVKIEDYFLALQVREREAVAIGGLSGELGRFIAFL